MNRLFSALTRHNPFSRSMRHVFVHIIMPVVNFLSCRGYVQYRPDGYYFGWKQRFDLQGEWEKGCHGNLRGDYVRLYFFMQNIETVERNGIEGAFAELGVYKGNTAKLMHKLAPERELYLFDTFSGFPDGHVTEETPGARQGHYAHSLARVSKYLGKSPKIHYCKGVFPETADMVPEDVRFAFVHLDSDLYTPTKAGLEFFYSRLAPGGVLVLHDYKTGWKGVTRAVDEFFADKPERPVRVPDKSGTAALIKNFTSPDRFKFNLFPFQALGMDVLIDTWALRLFL